MKRRRIWILIAIVLIAGIAYAVEQIVDLVSSGVNGIHLYTMNNPYVARRIHENINTIINSINNKKVI